MIVRDFDVINVARPPGKTDSPLIVNPNAVLSFAVAAQLLQPVARNCAESPQVARGVEHVELPKRRTFDGTELPTGFATKEPLGLAAPEGFDHTPFYYAAR
jgi:hypothetical protein